MTKQDKIQQRLEWIMYILRMKGYTPEFIDWEMNLLKEHKIGELADITCAIITSSEILDKWYNIPSVQELAREAKLNKNR